MLWWAEWSPQVKRLEKLQARGVRVAALENRPVVPEYLDDYWQAYLCLDRTRANGFDGRPVPISNSEVVAFATLHGWAQEDAMILALLCRELDNRYIQFIHDGRNKVKVSGDPPRSNRRPPSPARGRPRK
jgi:hypothetical protein